jgi:hypothetical protein
MTSSKRGSESQCSLACRAGPSGRRSEQSSNNHPSVKGHGVVLLVVVAAAIATASVHARSQSFSEDPSATAGVTASGNLDLTYVRPTQRTTLNNYASDALGPYPIAGAAFAAAINQLSNAPPEWNQGIEGFSKRFGSNFAIAAVGITTRYGLAGAFKGDTLYYRCECEGPLLRLRHAVISTLMGHRGEHGHRVFYFSALAAPYAGSMIAVYGWYPDRFGAKDAFRMGNYSLLGYMGGNIALEFFYSGPHALISRMRPNNTHGSPIQGPNR